MFNQEVSLCGYAADTFLFSMDAKHAHYVEPVDLSEVANLQAVLFHD